MDLFSVSPKVPASFSFFDLVSKASESMPIVSFNFTRSFEYGVGNPNNHGNDSESKSIVFTASPPLAPNASKTSVTGEGLPSSEPKS